jgi:hypothetical protein
VDPTTQDVYVSDRIQGEIYVYWRTASTADVRPRKDLEGWQPLGLGFGRDGTLRDGRRRADEGPPVRAGRGVGPTIQPTDSAFNYPNGVAADANGNVYVADSNNGRLRVFSAGRHRAGRREAGVREGDLGLRAASRSTTRAASTSRTPPATP